MTEAEVIAAVKVRMADIMPDNQTTVTAQPFIELLVNDCVENFYMMLPINLLPVTSFVSSATTNKYVAMPAGSAVLVNRKQLPADYIRFIEFQCNTWLRSATTLLQQGTPEHYAQYRKYMFGGNTRPKVALVVDNDLGRCIEYYNYDLQVPPVISIATCATRGTLQQIPSNLIDVYSWYVASVVFQSMEEQEASKSAMLRVQEFLQLHQ